MTRTEENLKAAFIGESQARNKYDYFAKVAREEGHPFIAKIFEETALNEMQHAKDAFKKLSGIGNTAENLKAAIEGEDYETKVMYPEFADIADEEGLPEIAKMFRQVGKVEEHHMQRFEKLLERLENGTLYKRDAPIQWKCMKCGFQHTGKEPPTECPACRHPPEYYEPQDIF